VVRGAKQTACLTWRRTTVLLGIIAPFSAPQQAKGTLRPCELLGRISPTRRQNLHWKCNKDETLRRLQLLFAVLSLLSTHINASLNLRNRQKMAISDKNGQVAETIFFLKKRIIYMFF